MLRGVTNALQWVSQPEPVKGSALAALIRTAEGGMNYWVDQAMVIQVGHDALAREAARLGDTGLAECVRFMQAVDARVDLSTEKERVKVQDRALEWLREIPTTGRTPASCVSAMALDMRNVTEAQVRDVWAGEAAAQVLEDLATRNHQLELKHESRFLRLLATRHAEYMEQRVEALYKAFEVQARDDLGPNARLATMATAAMGQLKPEQDQVLVARSALESMQALAVERGNESLAGQVGQWLALARAARGGRGGTRCAAPGPHGFAGRRVRISRREPWQEQGVRWCAGSRTTTCAACCLPCWLASRRVQRWPARRCMSRTW